MSTPLVLAVSAAALAAGWFGSQRFVEAPARDSSETRIAIWWTVRGLICAAVLVFALRAYLFLDGLIRGEDMWTGGLTHGDVILNALPQVLFEPGILLALAAILHLLSGIRSVDPTWGSAETGDPGARDREP